MPVNSITGKGANSGKTTYTTSSGTTVPPAAAVTCNTLTVQGPALKVITAATPVAGNMVVNAQGQVFAYIDLDATSGGEDAKVTQVVVQSTYDGGPNATSSDITNLELWGDPDNTDDTTEDILLETSNSTASMTDATTYATTTFTFKTPIKVSHLAVSRLTLKADVASSFTAGATHTFNVDGTNATVTSVGWSTGNGITETYSGNGQTQTLQTVGQLKVEYSADRASAAQFVAGTTGNSMMSYKMTASYESIDVTQFTVATTGGSANADIARVKVYVDGEQVGATGGYTLDAGGDALVTLSSGTLVVPKDDYVVVTLKVDLSERTQLTDAATLEIGLGDASGDDGDWGANGAEAAGSYLIVATGQQSGATITATNIDSLGTGAGNVVASYVHYLYDGVLTASLNSASPSGTQTPGSGKAIMYLDLTATGDEITINNIEVLMSGSATITGNTAAYWQTLDGSTTYATFAAGTVWMADTSDFDVLNDDSDTTFDTVLKVAAGETKTIRLIGDTTGGATNKTIQASITGSTNTTSGISWQNREGNAVDATLTKNLPVNGGSLVF